MFLAITFASRLTLCIVCSAIAILMFFQLIRDQRSRIFGQFMLILAIYGMLPLLTRMVRPLNAQIMFNASVILVALIPLYAFYLAVEYVEKVWQPWQTWYLRFELLIISVPTIVLSIFNYIHEYGYVSPDGLTFYKRYVHTELLLTVGVAIFIPITILCLRRLLNPRPDVDRRMVIGLLYFCLAAFTFMFPPLLPLSIDGFLFTIGSVLMTRSVLNQRLFNPMAELNQRLERRADQLATLTRVAQQTASLLSLNTLLQAVTQEIREAFKYDGAAVFQKSVAHRDLVCTAVSGIGVLGRVYTFNTLNPLGLAATTRQMVAIEDMAADHTTRTLTELPPVGSLVAIPLVLGSSEAAQSDADAEPRTIGVLQLYRRTAHMLSPDEREVLGILARQITIAIRNAELYEAAEEARRVADLASEAKTRFMSTMSHELRTPLQAVITISEFCQRPETYGEEVNINDLFRADLRQITSSGKHLLGVINNILDWSKLDARAVQIKFQPIDPVPILEDAITQSRPFLNPTVVLERAFPTSLPHVSCDDVRLRQILLNLLSNACKFTDEGRIVVNAERADDKLTFSVKDTGCGIAQAAHAGLFTRFTQIESSSGSRRGGTGLGLAISKQLVELQGGEIWFESVEHSGSTFYFSLPIVNDPADFNATPTDTASRVIIFSDELVPLPPQILIVDAQHRDWDHLTAEISRLGLRLVRATNAEQAKQLTTLLRPSIGLVVTVPSGILLTNAEEIVAALRAAADPQVTTVTLLTLSDAATRVGEIRAKVRDLATSLLPYPSSGVSDVTTNR